MPSDINKNAVNHSIVTKYPFVACVISSPEYVYIMQCLYSKIMDILDYHMPLVPCGGRIGHMAHKAPPSSL